MKRLLILLALLVPAVAAMPAAAQITTGTHTISFDGTSFTYDSSLAAGVDVKWFAGEPPDLEQPGGAQPPQTIFVLYRGDAAPAETWDGSVVVRVYDTALLTNYEFAQTQFTELQTLLADRPDLATYMTAPEEANVNLPYLPVLGSGQVLRARASYIETPTLQGVAFVTVFRQDVSPFVANEFRYTFQGLSADGSQYVSVVANVTAPEFPEEIAADFDYDAFTADYTNYLTQSIDTLNNAAPEAFTPSLSTVDALIQSISVSGASVPTAEPPIEATLLPPGDVTAEPTQGTGSVGSALAGTWTLVSYGDPAAPTAALAEPPVTLTFTETGVEGNGGCNGYGGTFTYSNNTIDISNLISTLMACVDNGVTEQESAFLSALDAATTFEITADGQLLLTYPDGVLVFNRA